MKFRLLLLLALLPALLPARSASPRPDADDDSVAAAAAEKQTKKAKLAAKLAAEKAEKKLKLLKKKGKQGAASGPAPAIASAAKSAASAPVSTPASAAKSAASPPVASSASAAKVAPPAHAMTGDWNAPPDAAKVSNPVPSTAASVALGMKYFTRQCFACHGAKGKGDGPDAADLEHKPHDLSAKFVKDQTDGELFWKITHGKLPMTPQEKILTPEQRWQVINYVRTLQK